MWLTLVEMDRFLSLWVQCKSGQWYLSTSAISWSFSFLLLCVQSFALFFGWLLVSPSVLCFPLKSFAKDRSFMLYRFDNDYQKCLASLRVVDALDIFTPELNINLQHLGEAFNSLIKSMAIFIQGLKLETWMKISSMHTYQFEKMHLMRDVRRNEDNILRALHNPIQPHTEAVLKPFECLVIEKSLLAMYRVWVLICELELVLKECWDCGGIGGPDNISYRTTFISAWIDSPQTMMSMVSHIYRCFSVESSFLWSLDTVYISALVPHSSTNTRAVLSRTLLSHCSYISPWGLIGLVVPCWWRTLQWPSLRSP